MLVTIERLKLDSNRLYGVIVNESEQLVCLHREVDFELDGYIFIRTRDINSRITDTPSQKYHEKLMRKEGYWKNADRFVRSLPIDSWATLINALTEKPVLVENENKSAHSWVGLVDRCTATNAFIHCFDTMGVFDDDIDKVPLRSITSLQFGDRYTQTHFKHLKTRTNNADARQSPS